MMWMLISIEMSTTNGTPFQCVKFIKSARISFVVKHTGVWASLNNFFRLSTCCLVKTHPCLFYKKHQLDKAEGAHRKTDVPANRSQRTSHWWTQRGLYHFGKSDFSNGLARLKSTRSNIVFDNLGDHQLTWLVKKRAGQKKTSDVCTLSSWVCLVACEPNKTRSLRLYLFAKLLKSITLHNRFGNW